MIAGGNTLVVNPHPSGRKVAAEGVKRFNKAIYEDIGIDNLICVIREPSLEFGRSNLQKSRCRFDLRYWRPCSGPRCTQQWQRAIVAGTGITACGRR